MSSPIYTPTGHDASPIVPPCLPAGVGGGGPEVRMEEAHDGRRLERLYDPIEGSHETPKAVKE